MNNKKKYIANIPYKNRDGHIREGYTIEIVNPNEFFNGKILKDALESRSLPSFVFANLVSKHPIQIDRYIKGEQLPPLDVFRKICMLLQIDPIEALNMKIVEIM